MPYKDPEKRQQYHTEWQRKNKDKVRKWNKERKIEIKLWVRSLKKKCSRCDERRSICLDFHHESGEKEIELSQVHNYGWSKKRILQEIKKCIILCANCHRVEHEETPNG